MQDQGKHSRHASITMLTKLRHRCLQYNTQSIKAAGESLDCLTLHKQVHSMFCCSISLCCLIPYLLHVVHPGIQRHVQ